MSYHKPEYAQQEAPAVDVAGWEAEGDGSASHTWNIVREVGNIQTEYHVVVVGVAA